MATINVEKRKQEIKTALNVWFTEHDQGPLRPVVKHYRGKWTIGGKPFTEAKLKQAVKFWNTDKVVRAKLAADVGGLKSGTVVTLHGRYVHSGIFRCKAIGGTEFIDVPSDYLQKEIK